MPPVMVVFIFPVADNDLCMQQRVETIDIQTLITQSGIERFDVAIVPGLAWRDV